MNKITAMNKTLATLSAAAGVACLLGFWVDSTYFVGFEIAALLGLAWLAVYTRSAKALRWFALYSGLIVIWLCALLIGAVFLLPHTASFVSELDQLMGLLTGIALLAMGTPEIFAKEKTSASNNTATPPTK